MESTKIKSNGIKILTEYYNFCNQSNNMTTKFNFKNASKNFKFYYSFKRVKGCDGLAVFDIMKKEFRVYNQCDFNINHDNINFEKFYLQNQLDSRDMSLIKYQRYFFNLIIKNYEASDKFTAIDKFKL